MKNKLYFILITVLSVFLAASALALMGCAEKELKIVESDPLPVVVPYKDFNVQTAVIEQSGVTYTYSDAKYINDYGEVDDIELNGYILNAGYDSGSVVFTVTANKGKLTAEKEITLSVKGEPDAIDAGFNNLWGDTPIKKTINYNPEYIKDGNSSVKVSFGGYYVEYGTQYAVLTGRLDNQNGFYDNYYYSIYKEANQDKAWEDAIITFWIYYSSTPRNHPNTKLDIGYRFRHHDGAVVSPEYSRDYEFGQTPIVSCKAGQWTQIAIRLKDLGKVTEMYLDHMRHYMMTFDNTKDCDLLSFKCRVYDEDYSSGDVKYNYSFYMDGVDILTYDDFTNKYPNFDFGSDYGDTVRKFNIENWKEGNKGLSFIYSMVDPDDIESDVFSLFYEYTDGEGTGHWHRLTEYITIDFGLQEADVGKVIDLGNGKYRYELMFKDCTANRVPGEEPDGSETVNLIWYRDYNTKLKTSEYKEINAYSE
ncbi:MAG: hypothetical protein J6Y43_01835 [Clostridia bacterium]|nr:hypothetical protein [Clostridia bacterium]